MAENEGLESGAVSSGLYVNDALTIPLHELTFLASTPGGPGGQHANRTASRVEVRFDLVKSQTLSDDQRRMLVGRYGAQVVAQSSVSRSQAHNKNLAMEELARRIGGGLIVRRTRRPTRPTLGSRRRRVDEKRAHGETKRQRRQRPEFDD